MTKAERIAQIQEFLNKVNSAEVTLDQIIKNGILFEEENLVKYVNHGLATIWKELYDIRKSIENDTISWDSEKSES